MLCALRCAILIALLSSAQAARTQVPADEHPLTSGVTSQVPSGDTDIDPAIFAQPEPRQAEILPSVFQSSIAAPGDLIFTAADRTGVDARDFQGSFTNDPPLARIGVDLYSPPEFEGGLLVFGDRVALKIGGYAKADFIYDFDPIDATDSFITTTIPVDAADRTNARFHARQTRLSFDTRWTTREAKIRIFVEGDFFGDGDAFRLRHAYGESGWLLVGQTWTTFTDVAAAPATLDFEGSVSSINRRQAQARITGLLLDGLEYALAVEDTSFIIEPPVGIVGEARSPSPDFVARLRAENDWVRLQIAGLYRVLGFQPVGEDVVTATGWGINTSAVVLLTERSKVYSQVLFGEGIGSYRSLPDAAPASADRDQLLGMFGWMVGLTQEWNDTLSSNFTYAENTLDNAPLQRPDEVHKTTYLAANLLSQPLDRVTVGIEYLFGLRQNIDGGKGNANRVQFAVIFDLP